MFQVEYSLEAIKLGSTAIGVRVEIPESVGCDILKSLFDRGDWKGSFVWTR